MFPDFTCAVNAVSGKSWFASTSVRAFSVVTESIGVTVMLSCLTLVDVCKIVNTMHLRRTQFLLNDFFNLLWKNYKFVRYVLPYLPKKGKCVFSVYLLY